MKTIDSAASIRVRWNKGKLVGQKAPFKLKENWVAATHSLRPLISSGAVMPRPLLRVHVEVSKERHGGKRPEMKISGVLTFASGSTSGRIRTVLRRTQGDACPMLVDDAQRSP